MLLFIFFLLGLADLSYQQDLSVFQMFLNNVTALGILWVINGYRTYILE